MIEKLESCKLCPHCCKVNRLEGKIGKCGLGKEPKINIYSLHFFEEPCISGKNGSGTVFFSHCNMKCKFCQNYEISQLQKGQEISVSKLADIFLELQKKGAENINLVTPTPHVCAIIEAIEIAKGKGLYLPIIYNTNGYEKKETLQLLKEYIDIYLPDFKYADNELAEKCSGIKNYKEVTTEALLEMYKQVGDPIFNEKGILQKGMIIRHLILPNHIENSKKVLKWIKNNLGFKVYISVMAQYFPTYLAKQEKDLNRKLSKREFIRIQEYLYELELEKGYIQELGKQEEKYVPNFK